MKHTLLLCLLFGCCMAATAQYDAALRYRSSSIPFSVAADTMIQRAMADHTDVNRQLKVD